jgi:hypothetical protein
MSDSSFVLHRPRFSNAFIGRLAGLITKSRLLARFHQPTECQVPILAALPEAFIAPQALADNCPPLAQSWR